MGRFVNDGVGADENALIKRIVVDGSPHLVLFARRDIYLGDEIRHGIVYGIKNLLRSESPRDYIDLERSLKHRPNVTICDIAHLLATHGNKTVEDFYCPNEGRLDIISEENIQAAESGKKWYSLSFLNTHPHQESSSSDSNYNPTTGSSDHLSLYDWFHHNNTKKREETLRRCSLVREISGLVDTQTVEQLFSSTFESGKPLSKGIPKKNLKQRRAVVDLDMSGSKEKGVKFLTPDKYKFSFALGEARTDERDIDEGGEGVLEIDLEKRSLAEDQRLDLAAITIGGDEKRKQMKVPAKIRRKRNESLSDSSDNSVKSTEEPRLKLPKKEEAAVEEEKAEGEAN
ncbi:unnamed protein product [Mytilus edulis]|uniref:Uncharacterized protein n=1 Tax=Mytilus edulis TaxID=6550 RepID=A0A8S3S6B3_MYTED|nr:unnamed protein product [Mytilus edulis]